MNLPTHADIIEAKEVNIQLYFGRFDSKLMLRNQCPSVYSLTLAK